MKRTEFLKFRQQHLDEFYNEVFGEKRSARAESAAVPERTEHRLSIGGRVAGDNEFQIVLRVQSQSGRAMSRARVIAEKLLQDGETVDLAVVRQVRTPSRPSFAESEGANAPAFGARAVRPFEIGYSIGHGEGTPGSITAFIETHKGAAAALSCNHVLALANRAEVGERIYQAGPPDNPANTRFAIGKLGDFTALSRSKTNEVDAAFCILDQKNEELGGFENIVPKACSAPDAGKRLKEPIDPFKLPFDATIGKIGRSTGYRAAKMQNVAIGVDGVAVFIPGEGNHLFGNMIEIEWPVEKGGVNFAEPGDSGALYFVEGERLPFAMHIASGELLRDDQPAKTVSYAASLVRTLKEYDATFRT